MSPICAGLLLSSLSVAAPEESARVDTHGDPLPAGAVARIGTVRFRHPWIYCAAFAPDGKTLATCGDGAIRLWNAETGQELGRLEGHEDRVTCIAYTADGKLLVSSGRDGTVRLWDVARREQRRSFTEDSVGLYGVVIAPDNRWVASGSYRGRLRVRDLRSGEELLDWFGGREGSLGAFAVSPDGKVLAVGSHDGKLRLWDTSTWKQKAKLEGHGGPIVGAAFTPDSKGLFSTAMGGATRLWDVETGKLRQNFTGARDRVGCLAASPDGKTVAAGTVEGWIHLWDAETGKQRRSWFADAESVKDLAFAPDGRVLASASGYSVKLWDTDTGKRHNPAPESDHSVGLVRFSPDGKRLAVVREGNGLEPPTDDRWVALYDCRTWREVSRLRGKPEQVTDLAFSSDGRTVFSAGFKPEQICLWDAATGEMREQIPVPTSWVSSLAVPSAGQLLYTTDEGCVSRDLTARRQRTLFKPDGRPSDRFILSPDGRWLAGPSERGDSLALWNVTTATRVREFGSAEQNGRVVAFSPDGRAFITAKQPTGNRPQKEDAVLWETVTGGERLPLRGSAGLITATFSGDGRVVATSSVAGVRLWDPLSVRELKRLVGQEGAIGALAFSPDGRFLATGADDTTVLVWDVAALIPAQPADPPLTKEWLAETWDNLAADSAGRAVKAMGALAFRPDQAVALVRERFGQTTAIDDKRLTRLIVQLDDEDFDTRETAERELRGMGRSVTAAVGSALKKPASPEAAMRLRRVLEPLWPETSDAAEQLRLMRTVELLERLATPEARQLLETLAASPTEAATYARASLERLKQRSAP
jgi:WD40 repeat protein